MPTRSPLINSDIHLKDPNAQHFSHMRMDSILHAQEPVRAEIMKQKIENQSPKPPSPTPTTRIVPAPEREPEQNIQSQLSNTHVRLKKGGIYQNQSSQSPIGLKSPAPRPPAQRQSAAKSTQYQPQNTPQHFTAPQTPATFENIQNIQNPNISQNNQIDKAQTGYTRPHEFDFDTITDTLDLPSQHDYRNDSDDTTRYELMPFIRDRIYEKTQPSRHTLALTILSATIFVVLVSTLIGFDPVDASRSFFRHDKEVAQAQEVVPDRAYKQWANAIDFGSNLSTETKNADPDNDGLSNYEEYLLQSNPLQAKSCENIESDSAGLLDLINPGTCREVEWSNPDEVQKFVSVFVAKKEYRTFIDRYNTELTRQPAVVQSTPLPPAQPTTAASASTQKIKEYILNHNPQSTLDPQLISDLSVKHSLKPELLLSLIEYGSNFAADYKSPNNLTNIGTTSMAAYDFKTDTASLETTAQLIHYLNIRSIPDCAQMLILYGGDRDACTQIETIYNQIVL